VYGPSHQGADGFVPVALAAAAIWALHMVFPPDPARAAETSEVADRYRTAGDVARECSAVCPGTRIRVIQKHEEPETDPRKVCEYVDEAARLLTRFRLEIETPSRIEIVEQVRHACGAPISASFDSATKVVRISGYSACAEMLSARPELGAIAASDWFRSIITHELVHAALTRRSNGPPPPLAQEYIAYALQLEMLGQSGRQTLLAAYPRDIPQDLEIFNSMYLQMSPLAFATNAYRHLFAQPDPVAFVSEILKGRQSFPEWNTFE